MEKFLKDRIIRFTYAEVIKSRDIDSKVIARMNIPVLGVIPSLKSEK